MVPNPRRRKARRRSLVSAGPPGRRTVGHLFRDVAVGAIGQKDCRDDADRRAEEDIEGDDIARTGDGKVPWRSVPPGRPGVIEERRKPSEKPL